MKELYDKAETYSLRGICMILIIIHHLFQSSVSDYGYSWSMPISVLFQSLGYLATSVFFLLSGYGLFLSIKMNQPIGKNYIVLHLKKLVSPFLFVWAIDLCIYLAKGGNDTSNIGISLITFGLPGGGNLLWFMKEIVVLYLLTFIIFSLKLENNWRLCFLTIIVLVFVALAAYKWNLLTMWWNSVLCFPLGMYCANNTKMKALLSKNAVMIPLLLIFMLTFVLTTASKSRYVPKTFGDIIAPVFMIVSSISFALFVISAIRYISIQALLFDYVGKNSLIFYLSHILLIVSLSFISQYWLYAVLVVLGTVVISYLYDLLNSSINSIKCK